MNERNGSDAVWAMALTNLLRQNWGVARQALDVLLQDHAVHAVDTLPVLPAVPLHIADRVSLWNSYC
jgi:hypothetical protein